MIWASTPIIVLRTLWGCVWSGLGGDRRTLRVDMGGITVDGQNPALPIIRNIP